MRYHRYVAQWRSTYFSRLTVLLLASMALSLVSPVLSYAEAFVPIDDGRITVEYLGKDWIGSDSRFAYEACAVDTRPGQGFSHISFQLEMCLPEFEVLYCFKVVGGHLTEFACDFAYDSTTGLANALT